LKKEYPDLFRASLLEKDGHQFLLTPVGIDEGDSTTSKIMIIEKCAEVMKKLGEAMTAELKKDGYTNIDLINNTFSFRMNQNGVKIASKNTGTDWTKSANKQKAMNVKIEFSIHTGKGNVGTAKIILPNGEEVTAWVGPSLTSQRARAALADDIQEKLQKKGWTNVTLINEKFNWASGPKK
jgi:hypothetical protein